MMRNYRYTIILHPDVDEGPDHDAEPNGEAKGHKRGHNNRADLSEYAHAEMLSFQTIVMQRQALKS